MSYPLDKDDPRILAVPTREMTAEELGTWAERFGEMQWDRSVPMPCYDCGQPRGPNGWHVFCPSCARCVCPACWELRHGGTIDNRRQCIHVGATALEAEEG